MQLSSIDMKHYVLKLSNFVDRLFDTLLELNLELKYNQKFYSNIEILLESKCVKLQKTNCVK